MSESKGLPEGWAESTLGTVLQPLDNGKVMHHGWSPQCDPKPSPADDVWGVLKTTAIQDGEYQSEHNKTLPSALRSRPDLEVKEGDLLLTCAGPRSRCGVPCLVRRTRPRLILSGKMYRFRPNAILLSSAYLEGYLRAKNTQIAIDAMKTGISDSGLNLTHDRFLRLSIPIPPLPEQHRIVEKIEELFSHLDAGVKALERATANLKRYRASVLKSAVEGKLTEEWRKDHPQAEDGQMLLDRILLERRAKWEQDQLKKFEEKGKEPPKNWQTKYEEPTHESGLFELPSAWAWACALQVCERVENGNTPPSDQMASGSGDVPFIKVYNLTRHGRLDFTVNPTFVSKKTHSERLSRSRVLPNDVLMNIVGPPLGKVSLVPDTYPEWNMNQAIVLFRSSTVVRSRYLAICLMCDEVLRWITRTAKATAGQFNISVSNSRLLPIPLPPLDEQEQIVALVEERLSQIDAAETTIDAELIRSKRLRQSILKQAFEGQLVPQNPKEEPASILLERIKASRDAEPPKKAKKAKAKSK